MRLASICDSFDHPSTHFGAKSDRNASFRLKKLYISPENATPAQRAEGGRNANEWNAHFNSIEAWLLDFGIPRSAERFTRFAFKIRDLSQEAVAHGGDGWVHIDALRGALRRKKPFSASWVDKAKRPLAALKIIEMRPGYVRYLGPPPRKRRYRPSSVKFYGCKTPQKQGSDADLRSRGGAIALYGNAEGERPARKPERNAQGRFTGKALEASDKLRGWRPRGRNIPPPPPLLTPEEIDEVEADIRRREEEMRKREDSRTRNRRSDPMKALGEGQCNGPSGGPTAKIAHAEGAPSGQPQPALVDPKPDRSSSAAIPDYVTEAYQAWQQARSAPENDGDGEDPLPPPNPPPKPNRPLPKPLDLREGDPHRFAPHEFGRSDERWGSQFVGRGFGALGALGLERQLLMGRIIFGGREGISENGGLFNGGEHPHVRHRFLLSDGGQYGGRGATHEFGPQRRALLRCEGDLRVEPSFNLGAQLGYGHLGSEGSSFLHGVKKAHPPLRL